MPQPTESNDTLLKLIQETNKNAKLELENQQLRTQLGKQFSTIKIFESNWKKLENAFDELAAEHYQLECESQKLSKKLDSLRSKNKQLEDELELATRELFLKDGAINSLEQKNQRTDNSNIREREREREREQKLLKKLALYRVYGKLLRKNVHLLANERDNWNSSARIANSKLRQAEQKLEKLQLDYKEEKCSHQLTLTSLISINKRRQNLRNENDRLRDELSQKEKQLTLFKLWFPNQTPSSIAQGWQSLDNQYQHKVRAIKKQAAKWKKAYQQEQHNHSLTKQQLADANLARQQAEVERDNYQQQLDNHVCPTIDNSELESLRAEVKEKDQKIVELEQEIKALKDKAPVVDNSEIERLLNVVAEKETIIKELELKLAQTEPQVIKVESEEVQELRNELVRQEKRITRLHVIYLVILSTAALVGLVRLIGGKISKKKPR